MRLVSCFLLARCLVRENFLGVGEVFCVVAVLRLDDG